MRFRRLFGAVLVLALQALWLSPAKADYRDSYPKQFSMTPKGVNIQTGHLSWSHVDVSVGPLKLVHSIGDGPRKRQWSWRHNYSAEISIDTSTNTTYYVVVADDTRYLFKLTTGGLVPGDASTQGMNIATVGSQMVVTDHSGNQYTYATPASGVPGKLQRALYANGSAIAYTYDAGGRLKMVASNLGYAIIFDYDAGNNMTAACGFNTAQTFVSAATTCAGAGLKAGFAYDGSNRLTSITDTTGGVTTFTYNGTTNFVSCISLVNSSTCALSMSGVDMVGSQTTASGNLWQYTYTPPENSADVPQLPCRPSWSDAYMQDPSGAGTTVLYDRGYLVDVGAPEGETQYLYPDGCFTNTLVSMEIRLPRPSLVRKPGGVREYYDYDTRGDVVRKVLFPIGVPDPKLTTGGDWVPTDLDLQKCCLNLGTPQIPAGSVVYQYNYLASYGAGTSISGCGSGPPDAKQCDKPVSVIDPNGNQTDYTYDPAHGGILTETAPSVPYSGNPSYTVRPQTRYAYVQRQAWVKTSGGGYAQTGENVWLLASKSICRTNSWSASGCQNPATGAIEPADEVITTYDYGLDSGPNNLLLRGVVEDSGSGRLNLRTCYAYNAQGNKISETKPRGTGATCP